jgi:hypothetical protein
MTASSQPGSGRTLTFANVEHSRPAYSSAAEACPLSGSWMPHARRAE